MKGSGFIVQGAYNETALFYRTGAYNETAWFYRTGCLQ
jgi:hypothetical protein